VSRFRLLDRSFPLLRAASLLALLVPLAGFAPERGARRAPASVAPDSIYSLAVDSARYAQESFVFLLDEGVVRYEADGKGSRTYRQVIQILKEDAVERWAEFKFDFAPGHERLTVNWIRVVGLDGTLVSDKPGISQDADVPAPMGDPSYVERKVRRMSMPNVRPGTLIDYSYTIEELKPFRTGDFYTGWRVNPGILVRRSRLMLDTPVSLHPRIKTNNLTFEPVTVESHGRRTITWATRDVPKVEPEPFAAGRRGMVRRPRARSLRHVSCPGAEAGQRGRGGSLARGFAQGRASLRRARRALRGNLARHGRLPAALALRRPRHRLRRL
jgi:hypothetical protein